MTEPVFFDTNIVLYAADASERAKQERALDLLKTHLLAGTGVVSTQVLSEFFYNATRKLRMTPEKAREGVSLLMAMQVWTISPESVLRAIDLQQSQYLSYWDALIVESARASGCRVLYSEDMQHGALIAGVRIVNPFELGVRETRARYGDPKPKSERSSKKRAVTPKKKRSRQESNLGPFA